MTDRWQSARLADVCAFLSGGTPRKDNQAFWGGDFPWVSAKDLKHLVIGDAELKLTAEGVSHGTRVAPKGSVLVLVRGMTLLKDLPVGYVARDVAFNQDIKALVPEEGLYGLFLAYALIARRDQILELVDKAGHGTGRLDTDLLKEVIIEFPGSGNEQQAILRILTACDHAIDLTEQLIYAKRQHKLGLTPQVLMGGRRFNQFVRSSATQRTPIGSLPAEWDYVTIGEIAQQVTERNSEGSELPVLSCTKYDGLVDSMSYFGRQIFSEDTELRP